MFRHLAVMASNGKAGGMLLWGRFQLPAALSFDSLVHKEVCPAPIPHPKMKSSIDQFRAYLLNFSLIFFQLGTKL